MKRVIILFTLLTSISLGLNAQITLTDYDSASKQFDELFGNESQLDINGNILIDMGSASAGRHQFHISNVKITMEQREEEPGCADICPPRILIHFKCEKSACISDPALNSFYYRSGIIEFHNLKKGREAFAYLLGLQEFAKKN